MGKREERKFIFFSLPPSYFTRLLRLLRLFNKLKERNTLEHEPTLSVGSPQKKNQILLNPQRTLFSSYPKIQSLPQ